ncbi:MAG: hypothetical protein LW606_09525 [Ilumatobacteraceae bacterium]|jgi:cation:H+ antiporter|nr:hypothetical protein [Ilumatobacteraceae bacterium]
MFIFWLVIGVGAVLGSNVFNTLFIVGIATVIQPVEVSQPSTAIALVFGAVAMLCAIPRRSWELVRRRGFVLILMYLAYVVVVIATRS